MSSWSLTTSPKRSSSTPVMRAGALRVLIPMLDVDALQRLGHPMNALANSQMDELTKFIGQVPGERTITFDRYTGQDDKRERKRIAGEPLDILLTNFMMLELLMTRQEEFTRAITDLLSAQLEVISLGSSYATQSAIDAA